MHIFARCYWRILFSFISILAAHLIFYHMIFAFFFFLHDMQLIDKRLPQNPLYLTTVLEKRKNSGLHPDTVRHNNICCARVICQQ